MLSKRLYDKCFIKSNGIDPKIPSTSGLVTKIQFDWNNQSLKKKIEDVHKKIPSTIWLVKKTNYRDLNKRLNVTGLVTTTVLNTKATEVEKKIAEITNLNSKDCHTKALSLFMHQIIVLLQ